MQSPIIKQTEPTIEEYILIRKAQKALENNDIGFMTELIVELAACRTDIPVSSIQTMLYGEFEALLSKVYDPICNWARIRRLNIMSMHPGIQ